MGHFQTNLGHVAQTPNIFSYQQYGQQGYDSRFGCERSRVRFSQHPDALLFSCFSSAIAAFLLTLLPCFSLCCNSLFFLTIRAGATEFHRKISKQISFGSTEVHQKSANLQRRSSTITRISIFVPTYCDPYTAHILLATTNVTTTYLLQDGISHLITPVACSNQSAAELAKLLRSILLCNKSNSCFFRTNLSSRNP